MSVRVIARASRDAIVNVMTDGTVRIRIAAPPVDGAANESLVAFLADVLDISKSRIAIVSGKSGRDKLISVLDLDAATVHGRIAARLR